MIYVTSDLHFGHGNIIKYCGRPYPNAATMDAQLIANWNSVVGIADTVWFLGDFAFHHKLDGLTALFDQLHGIKHLIVGNHDGKETKRLGWHSVLDYTELMVNGRRVVMCHYPMEEWNCDKHGSVMLHGHSHGKSRPRFNRLDVGVDVHAFTPIELGAAIKLATGE